MAAIYPVTGDFNTTPSYSGTFIPTIWSQKLNAKFYRTTLFGEIANTDYQGEISNVGDKVIINSIPDITVFDYVVGTNLDYEVPVPSTSELVIDKGKGYAFKVADVLEYQAKPDLMRMFSDDAAQKMRIHIDSDVLFGTFNQADAANKGATAGARSGSYNLGTDTDPIELTPTSILPLITQLSSVFDEQDVPDSDRALIIDPATRNWLMHSNLAQANLMGDPKSIIRNGLIGSIDRFRVYVSNNTPRAIAGKAWVPGLGNPTTAADEPGTANRRTIVAIQKSALTFASQMTKMETLRNPNDFGDLVRGLNVYGYKVLTPKALALAIVA
jgi:hypothetical protein